MTVYPDSVSPNYTGENGGDSASFTVSGNSSSPVLGYLEGNYAENAEITSTGKDAYFILYKNYAGGATISNSDNSTFL